MNIVHLMSELTYIAVLPSTLLMLSWSLFRKSTRLFPIAAGVLLLWIGEFYFFQWKHERIATAAIHYPDDALSNLGSPDIVYRYSEGDEQWIYVIRVWPFKIARVIAVYKNATIGEMTTEQFGFWRTGLRLHRSPDESRKVREFLAKLNAK